MEIKASLKYYRIAPRKMRLVADLIRGKSAEEAKKEIIFSTKRSAPFLLKLLNSAVANAKNNLGLKEEEAESLYIKEIIVNEGPTLKRWRPVSRGSAHEIQKKTSHVTLILDKKVKRKKEDKGTEKPKKVLKNKKSK